MKRQSILLFTIVVILVTTSISRGDLTGYITTGTEVVWTNFDTGTQTSLGPSGIDNIMAMAILPVDGSLYATDDYGQLWKINTTSGAGTLIGDVERCTDALSFAPDGTLYATLEFNRLRKINVNTAEAITIGPLFSYTGAITLAINSNGEAIAWDRWTESLFEIDLSNGSTTLIGHLDTTDPVMFGSMDYGPDGILYGWYNDSLYSIDVDNLEVTFLRSFPQGYVGGAGGGGSIAIVILAPLEATIDILDDTITPKTKWIKCQVWPPDGYSYADIDIETILLEWQIPVSRYSFNERKQRLIVTFPSSGLNLAPSPDPVELTVSGELVDGNVFEGSDFVTVVEKGGKKK